MDTKLTLAKLLLRSYKKSGSVMKVKIENPAPLNELQDEGILKITESEGNTYTVKLNDTIFSMMVAMEV